MKIYENEYDLTLKAKAFVSAFLKKLKNRFSNEERNDIILQLSILFDMTLEETKNKVLDSEMVNKDIDILEDVRDFEINISEENIKNEISKLIKLEKEEEIRKFQEKILKQKEKKRKEKILVKMTQAEVIKKIEKEYDLLMKDGYLHHVKPTSEKKKTLTRKERRMKKLQAILSQEPSIYTFEVNSFSQIENLLNLSQLSQDKTEKIKRFLLNHNIERSASFIINLIDKYYEKKLDNSKILDILRDKRFKEINIEMQKILNESF